MLAAQLDSIRACGWGAEPRLSGGRRQEPSVSSDTFSPTDSFMRLISFR